MELQGRQDGLAMILRMLLLYGLVAAIREQLGERCRVTVLHRYKRPSTPLHRRIAYSFRSRPHTPFALRKAKMHRPCFMLAHWRKLPSPNRSGKWLCEAGRSYAIVCTLKADDTARALRALRAQPPAEESEHPGAFRSTEPRRSIRLRTAEQSSRGERPRAETRGSIFFSYVHQSQARLLEAAASLLVPKPFFPFGPGCRTSGQNSQVEL